MRHSIPKPLALILNYPSNPTAYVASLDFYKGVVGFAKKHDIIILSDLAYAEIYYDVAPPPSVLEVPGAVDVSVEFTSMSKTFSMPGWRMGFAVGNERLIGGPVAGEILFSTMVPSRRSRWRQPRRSTAMVPISRWCAAPTSGVATSWSESFANAGWQVPAPLVTMFVWAPLPERFRDLGSLEFSKLLIEKADVAVAPGVGFG